MIDVAVIGGGPAGIAAAVAAAEAGRSVVLIDESPRPGGQIWRHTDARALPSTAQRWLRRLAQSSVRTLSSTTLVDARRSADAFELCTSGVDTDILRARTMVIATGARELLLPFPGWTLPGVFGVGGGQALVKAGADVRDRRVVVAGSGPLLLPVAAVLSAAGAHVTHVLEQAPTVRVLAFGAGLWRTPQRIVQAAAYRAQSARSRYRTGVWVTRADGDTSRVHEVTITNGEATQNIRCDLLCVGYGLVPSLEVARLLDCATENGRVRVDASQRTSTSGVFAAGEATGVAGVEKAILEGVAAGRAAAARKERLARVIGDLARERAFARRMDVAFRIRPEVLRLAQDDTIVCRCEDVAFGALKHYSCGREAKLHARAGMGACQGRVCGTAMQHLFGWTDTSVRPPLVAAAASTLMSDYENAEE